MEKGNYQIYFVYYTPTLCIIYLNTLCVIHLNRRFGEISTLGEDGKVPQFGCTTYPSHFCVNRPDEGESLKRQFKELYKTAESHIKLECKSLLTYFHYGKFSHPARSKPLLCPPAPQLSILGRKRALKSSLTLLLI